MGRACSSTAAITGSSIRMMRRSPLTQKIVQDWMKRAARRANVKPGVPHPPPHVLLAPGDEGGAGTSHPGAGRPSGLGHDAAVHAPESVRDRERDSPAGSGVRIRKFWRHCGDGLSPKVKSFGESELSGGGGGSRTRVRKHIIKEIYMRIRFWVLVSSVRKRPKPPDTRLGVSRLRTPSRRSKASLFNVVRPPATRRGQGERHCLFN